MERTLAIIKSDAMEAGHEVALVNRIEDEGFVVLDSKTIHLDKVCFSHTHLLQHSLFIIFIM